MLKKTAYTRDPSHNVLRWEQHPLDAIFEPKTIALIGATDRAASVGRIVLENLKKGGFSGAVYGVNPHRHDVLGVPTYPSIAQVPREVDLAIVVTPASTVPRVIRDCVAAGVAGAVVISAGFKEIGSEGTRLETEVLTEARRGRLRLIGPNCLGVMNPLIGLNATFAQTIALAGNVTFLSQSGALCTAILDWSLQQMVGFRAFVSTGSMLDIGWGDLIYYFGDDPHTQSILIYMESIGEPRTFLSAAREVARTKPIIVIKAGRTEAAAKAAASHTGALTGSDEVLDAAFRRCGVLRVNRIAELFEIADVLGKQPRPRGRRLAIVTNAGGPGVLATDALLGSGGELAPLSAATIDALNSQLPPHWSHGNPVDVLGDADPERYAAAVQTVLRDPNCDGLLAIVAPQGMTDPTRIAKVLVPCAHQHRIPIFASWMGGAAMTEGEALLSHAGIPTFAFPDAATRAFTYLWQYSENLRALGETPSLPAAGEVSLGRPGASALIQNVLSSGRTLLTEWESKKVLAAYDIPVVPTEIAGDEEEAAAHARSLGYPVVVKLNSRTITHKTDVHGVWLDLTTPDAVRTAFREIRAAVQQRAADGFDGVTVQPMVKLDGYELILGSSLDPQFGPVLLFGAGGQLVEILGDRSLGLPPLTSTLARRLLEQTRIYRALTGIRGRKPTDLAALESVLVRFSQMIAEQRRIKEVDINPLLASPGGIVALDARIVLHEPALADADLPTLAIRPYPEQYTSSFVLADGTALRIRPIRPEDEPLMVHFHEKLSQESVQQRYLENLKLDQRTAHERLTRICFIDYDREMVLVAVWASGTGDEIVAVGRLSKFHGNNDAEFAMLIRDDFQRRGLGIGLLAKLLEIARIERIDHVVGFTLAGNSAMRKIAERLDFTLDFTSDPDFVIATKAMA